MGPRRVYRVFDILPRGFVHPPPSVSHQFPTVRDLRLDFPVEASSGCYAHVVWGSLPRHALYHSNTYTGLAKRQVAD